MLVTLKQIIALAEEKSFCIPAFNVYNMESVMGVIYAAEELKAPVILQVYPRLINQGTADYLAPIVLEAAKRASVPVCFHLDHGPTEIEVQRSLYLGATGIMIDGSTHSYEENVALTRHIVELCEALNIGCEGEIGHVGSVNDDVMDELTDPDEAADFAKKTGVTCLAVLVGNAHGHYKKPPKIDIDRIKAIREKSGGVPLVLHGGSGIPDETVREAIKAGIRKMNIGTDVCCAFSDSALASLNDPKRSLAIDLFMKPVIESIKELALSKIRLTGAEGKA
ncbi:MAG: class II fructose-bisphosphate aldolase [Ruminococcaceae bacterium]|nr:class II fructose-bisphosphate aldolase [Oscillospiraceae bacterium]